MDINFYINSPVSDYIMASATIVGPMAGAAIAAWIVMKQVKKQHEHAIAQQIEEYGKKVRLQVYDEISDAISEMDFNRLYGELGSIGFHLQKYHEFKRLEIDFSPPMSVEEFQSKFVQHANSMNPLKAVLEKYRFIHSPFDTFKLFVLFKRQDMLNMMFETIPIYSTLAPIKKGDESNIDFSKANDFEQFFQKLQHVSSIVFKLVVYIEDIQREAQKYLVADIFKTPIPPRDNSMDEEDIVLTSQNKVMLEKVRGIVKEKGGVEVEKIKKSLQ